MKRFLFALILASQSLQAQVPATVHATWTPNPSTDNIVQYQVTLDIAAPITVLPTVCTTICSQILTVPAFGSHTISLVAQNLKLSTDPTSLQSSTPTTITFTLGAMPTVVAGLKVIN